MKINLFLPDDNSFDLVNHAITSVEHSIKHEYDECGYRYGTHAKAYVRKTKSGNYSIWMERI